MYTPRNMTGPTTFNFPASLTNISSEFSLEPGRRHSLLARGSTQDLVWVGMLACIHADKAHLQLPHATTSVNHESLLAAAAAWFSYSFRMVGQHVHLWLPTCSHSASAWFSHSPHGSSARSPPAATWLTRSLLCISLSIHLLHCCCHQLHALFSCTCCMGHPLYGFHSLRVQLFHPRCHRLHGRGLSHHHVPHHHQPAHQTRLQRGSKM
jgi:hypothetical protein